MDYLGQKWSNYREKFKERKEWKERQVLHAFSHMHDLGFECVCARMHVCVSVCMCVHICVVHACVNV